MTKAEEKRYIKLHYETMRAKDIGEVLGRSSSYVTDLARGMGMYRRVAEKSRCKACLMYVNSTCLARLDKCSAARFTRAEWPDLTKRISYFD